jgi:PAS domain S-box-containing protein
VIDDWGRRISDARARITSEMHLADGPLQHETNNFLDELSLAFEELQVAEEELHAQTEELSSSRALLEAERLRYRTLFEHAPVAYVTTDREGVIKDANRAASSLFNVTSRWLSGKPLIVFVAPSRRRDFRDQLAAFVEKEMVADLHLRIHPRSARPRRLAASIGILRDRDGAIVELRWLLVDETEHRRRERRVRSLNAELRQRVAERTVELTQAMETQEGLARAAETARREAERASRDKSKLIAVVSHELRTPLAAIAGYAEMLLLGVRGQLTEPQRGDVQRIQAAQAHILRLVDDLVGYSKLETGQLRFDIVDVVIGDAIASLVSLVRPQASVKEMTISVVENEMHAVVKADQERLRQIVLNLLSNAIKFTPHGGRVVISASVDESNVRIDVADNGIGIPQDKLDLVFEPYVRLEPARASGETGWGLGLAISRELARAMDGDLTASRLAENGTVFTLRLPRSTRIAATPSSG